MKRNINLVNKQTILTYAGISVICTIVVFGGGVLVGGMRYTKLTDLLIMGIAITITMTLIYTLLSPKGVLKIDIIDGKLEIVFESHNFIFKRKPQRMLIENGSTYNFISSRYGIYDTEYELRSDESSIIWRASSGDFILKKSLIEYFASLGTETSDGSYMFTNSIVLESEAELNIRNKKRKVVQISVIIMILIGIIYQLVAMYDEYRYYQRQDARFDNINNQLQESYGTDLNEIFDVEF